jgi:hypothetical protein
VGDDIVCTTIGHSHLIGEAATAQRDVGEANLVNHRLPARDMFGHHVHTDKAPLRVRCGGQDQAKTIAAAKVDISERRGFAAGRHNPAQSQHRVKPRRLDRLVKIARIQRVGNIAVNLVEVSHRAYAGSRISRGSMPSD